LCGLANEYKLWYITKGLYTNATVFLLTLSIFKVAVVQVKLKNHIVSPKDIGYQE